MIKDQDQSCIPFAPNLALSSLSFSFYFFLVIIEGWLQGEDEEEGDDGSQEEDDDNEGDAGVGIKQDTAERNQSLGDGTSRSVWWTL